MARGLKGGSYPSRSLAASRRFTTAITDLRGSKRPREEFRRYGRARYQEACLKALVSLLIAASLSLALRPAVAADIAPAVDAHSGPPIHFYVILTPADESTPTESTGTGRIDFDIDRQTQRISSKGSFNGLPATSRPTCIYVHAPQ